jgi:peptidylprolyl isomerase domain and WD repeat-containing protein 1
MQQAGTTIYKVDDMEFGRRLAVERELELPGCEAAAYVWSRSVSAGWSGALKLIVEPQERTTTEREPISVGFR